MHEKDILIKLKRNVNEEKVKAKLKKKINKLLVDLYFL